MADIRTLKLALLADTKDFIDGLDKADKETRSFTGKLDDALKVGAAAFLAVGAAATTMAIKIGTDAIGAASDFSEEISKSNVIFGDASKAVQKFADTAANSLGQSKQQALQAASTFATFGKSAGLTGQKLASFSTGLVSLASDLASFNNSSPEEAINAIGSALRGEAEPLRKFGVLLNDATLKQEAFKQGLISNVTEALTPANKVLAAQAVIYAQTQDAQGDFARTSDGLANSQRQLAANIQDVKIQLGEALLPTVLLVSQKIKDILIPAIQDFVSGLTGGEPNSVKNALRDAKGRVIEFNDGLEITANTGAYGLGVAITQLGQNFTNFNETLFGLADNESGLKKFLDLLTQATNAINSAITAYNNLPNQAKFAINPAPELAQLGVNIGNLANSAKNNVVNIYNNVKSGLSDPQATARAIYKVTKTASLTSGLGLR